ncbi:MAG: SRPBCC domain-containing protein [Bacteroidales bacterium]|nr:SRPBCC domain-containing protein [Bacteroidales bacterium]
MKTRAMLLNFSVDKENKVINVEREFAAPISKVWAAWTKSELLDKWWAPRPWQAKTKFMDFRNGGHWLYAMVGPEGEEHWARADFFSIIPVRSFSTRDSFCDAEGNVNHDLPVPEWTNTFTEDLDSSRVSIVIRFNDYSEIEKYIEMGFKEGFIAALENLDELLAHSA